MSNLVTQWKALDRRQNEINDQDVAVSKKRDIDTVNYIINMAKIDLENQMNRAELKQI